MKIILLLLAGMVFASSDISAQLTLSQTSYPSSVIGIDSLKKTNYNSSFPPLGAAVAGIWDMTVLTDTAPVYFAYRMPTSPYQFADSGVYSLGKFSYQGNGQSSITDTGILDYGINIQKIAYDLSSMTLGTTDSLFIPAQGTIYTRPHTKIAFPATYNSSWASSYSSDLNFEISLASLSYVHAPGIVRTYTTETDSVIGWGKMRVTDAAGFPSAYFNVLQVKTITHTTDSFFINGVPADPMVLIIFGLQQGQRDSTYEQYYYRQQEVTALAQVTFADNTFTQPKSAITHIQRLIPPDPISVKKANGQQDIKVFPNPVIDDCLFIEVPAAGTWDYQLLNSSGIAVMSGSLLAKGKIAQLLLPAYISQGIYSLRIYNCDRPFITKLVEVIK